jgi:hypothetical protein
MYKKYARYSLCLTAVLAIYIDLYLLNIQRSVFTLWVGEGCYSVCASYRICNSVSRRIFFPLHWIDANVLRTEYWEPFPEHLDPILQDQLARGEL